MYVYMYIISLYVIGHMLVYICIVCNVHVLVPPFILVIQSSQLGPYLQGEVCLLVT